MALISTLMCLFKTTSRSLSVRGFSTIWLPSISKKQPGVARSWDLAAQATSPSLAGSGKHKRRKIIWFMWSVLSGNDLLKPELINADVCIQLLCLQHCLMQCRCTFLFFTAVRPSISKSRLSKLNVDFETFRTRDMFLRLFSTGSSVYWQSAGSRVWIVGYNQCLKSTNIPDLPATKRFLLLRAPSPCAIVLKWHTGNAWRHKTRIAIALR